MSYIEQLELRRLLSGVTLVTHGQGGDAGGEVELTADLISDRVGGATQYIMEVSGSLTDADVVSFTRDPDTPENPASGETIIRLDWSDANTTPTTIIARAVADYLLAVQPNGRALVEQELGLAGGSRGASVVSNLAAELGERGVWVDQVTYLDPVPVNVPLVGVDGPMRVTENIVFADNYWREDDDLGTFDGQPVDGAHNVDLGAIVGDDNDGDPHVAVAAYYIATVDPDVPIVSPARSSWFGGTRPDRDETGFAWSRIGGLPRPSDGVAVAFGGSAERDGVDETGSQWANIREVNLLDGNTTFAGKTIRVRFRFDDSDSASTVSIFLDEDRNPYNGNTVSRIARRTYGPTANGGARLHGSTIEALPGTYFVYAQIADSAGHVRYAYMPQALTLTAPPESLNFARIDNGILEVSGTAGLDRIYATTNGESFAVTKHDFTQLFSSSQVNGIVIDGQDGNDSIVLGVGMMGSVLLGGDGDDTLIGADNDDTLIGGAGKDRLLGGGGSDRLSGAGGNDVMDGGSGPDRLYGDAGNDLLLGGTQNDYFVGGSGTDTSSGGSGFDRAERDPDDIMLSIEDILG